MCLGLFFQPAATPVANLPSVSLIPYSILYLDENLMAMMGRLKTEFHRSARATKIGLN
jgi:hypothetical protein